MAVYYSQMPLTIKQLQFCINSGYLASEVENLVAMERLVREEQALKVANFEKSSLFGVTQRSSAAMFVELSINLIQYLKSNRKLGTKIDYAYIRHISTSGF